MEYLEQRASLLYFKLTKHSYYLGVLSWVHVQDRMFSLIQMCEPEDPTYKAANRLLSLEGYDGEGESWGESERNNKPGSLAEERSPKGRIQRDDDGFIIFYHGILRPKIGNFIKLMLIFSHQFRMDITKEENNQSSMHISVGSTKVQLKMAV